MRANLSASSRSSLVLVSTGPVAHLAEATLCKHLGISRADAYGLLENAPAILADGLDPVVAHRVAGLLQAFGLRVRFDTAAATTQVFDLSIQFAVPVRKPRTIRILAEQTGLDEATVQQALHRPGGLILRGLTRAGLDRYHAGLGRLANLSLVEADPETALYDAFLVEGKTTPALSAHLQIMGVAPDAITGAVAAGLDRHLCSHLERRANLPRMMVLNRAFQRYDLYLSRATGWVTRDLADFLVSRTGLPRSRFEVLSNNLPMRIEYGLCRAAALQFRADYAAIGLHTSLALSGLAETADNAAA